ncbi:MAG TPA: hypothetical protein VFA60_03835 [Terriglobales bacterium]|nr:hypothetical protein [Terriglobales bacterium]
MARFSQLIHAAELYERETVLGAYYVSGEGSDGDDLVSSGI